MHAHLFTTVEFRFHVPMKIANLERHAGTRIMKKFDNNYLQIKNKKKKIMKII